MSGDWRERADQLAAAAIRRGEPTAWFDRLYAEAASSDLDMPWSRAVPHPLLDAWAQRASLAGEGRTAVVVGAGLGAPRSTTAPLG